MATETAPDCLQVRLLGGFGVDVGNRPVPSSAWRRKRAAAVVKLLALEPAHRLHRDQVLEALWPEHEPAAAAGHLRFVLHHARRRLEEAGAPPNTFLARDGDGLVLGPPGRIQVDIDAFETAVSRAWRAPDPAAAAVALGLYGGDLLPEDPYEEWVEVRRATLRASFLSLLRRQAELHAGRGELGPAIAALQRLVAAEPTDEETHTALMRLLAQTGRRRQALAQYQRLEVVLERELAAAPEPATRALFAAIRDGRFPAAPRPLAPAPAAPAVVPAGGGEVPSQRASSQPLTALPSPVDALIGRERELAELRQLLATGRLVTLTGPGGIGKTRLALAVAQQHAATGEDPVAFADLAPIRDAALVVSAIATALGAHEESGRTLLDVLKAQVGSTPLLLVLDNFEQVLTAAPVVTDLLSACPRLSVLTTSRARLRVRGERAYPVPPLVLPDPGHLPAAAALPQYAAVALFIERARAARGDFVVTNETAPAVAAICHKLDGLPLAIELAAARVRILPPPALLARLDRPLRLLVDGPRDLPTRQQTLRATIAWSHDLLTPPEQTLFRRLAVFAGGFTLGAAEDAVAKAESREPSEGNLSALGSRLSALDLVAALEEQSLLRRTDGASAEDSGTGPRYAMLETIREYGLERLDAAGEAEATWRAHAAYFLALAEAAEPELSGPRQVALLDQLELEHDNFRAVLAWTELAGGPDLMVGLRLAAALWKFWYVRGHLTEGRGRLERTLALWPPDEPDVMPAVRASALLGAGRLAAAQGDGERATHWYKAALALQRELGDRRGQASSLADLGLIARDHGDYPRATELHEQALALSREIADRPSVAGCLLDLGDVALEQGQHERAALRFEECLALFRQLGDQRGVAATLTSLGALAFRQGELDRASQRYRESLALWRGLGDKQGIASALVSLGEVLQQQGDLDQAGTHFEQAMPLFQDLRDTPGAALALYHRGRLAAARGDLVRAAELIAESVVLAQLAGDKAAVVDCLEGLAGLFAARGEAAAGARLFGAVEALREAIGSPVWAVYRADHERTVSAVRAVLDGATFAAAWAAGRAMTLDQAVVDVIGDLGTPQPDDQARGFAPSGRRFAAGLRPELAS